MQGSFGVACVGAPARRSRSDPEAEVTRVGTFRLHPPQRRTARLVTQRLFGPMVAIGLLVVPKAALGQVASLGRSGWLADRARAEGPGFRVGDFELHPGIGVELGWDSNLYYSEDGRELNTAILRVTPHLLFSTLGPQRRQEGAGRDDTGGSPPTVAFRGGISAAYYEFFADESRRNVDLIGSLRLHVLPERPFSFSVYNDFVRGIRPFTENFTPSASQARISNQAGLDLHFQTDGNVVQVRAGYVFGLDYFEGGVFQYGNSFTHNITLVESFRFLPQTSLVHDTTLAIQDYFGPTAGAPSFILDNVRLRSRLGINGAITETVQVQAMFGYAAGFFQSTDIGGMPYDQDYDSVVAQVQFGWQIVEGVRLAIGYDRDFFPSFLGNYYSRDRGYVNFQMLLGGVFLVAIDADVGYADFGLIRPIMDSSGGERADTRVGSSLFAEYRFADWLGVNATLRYAGQFTPYRFTNAGLFIDPAQFNKVELFGGVRVFY